MLGFIYYKVTPPSPVICYIQRRSLRERKKRTYKDDFDYNLSDEDGEKEHVEGAVPAATYAGNSAGQSYVPVGPEVEETMTVEKILAMRAKQVRVLSLYCKCCYISYEFL